jgi:acetyl-CoA synthetase
MAEQEGTGMEALMEEGREFPPPPEFSADAHIKSMEQYEEMY